MFGFLGFILILFLFIVLFVLVLIGNLVRSIFSFGRRSPKQYKENVRTSTHEDNFTSSSAHQNTPSNKKKIFGKDEGEYVEYEEIK